MLQLAGALTTFSQKIHPRDLPVYDHENLGLCFTDLDEKLRYLLETVVPSNFVSLPLKQVSPNIYATSIDKDEYLRGNPHVPRGFRRCQPGRHHRTCARA
ncbi:MAG: type VI secretion system baseplate subunit TssK [Ignavibacteriota bacterium]